MTASRARALARASAALGAFAITLSAMRPASAESRLSLDVGAAFPSASGNDDGWGVGLRYGHRWQLAILTLTPELGVGYHAFGGPSDASTFAAFGGGRVGIDFGIEPSVFAHAGVGNVDTRSDSHTSLAYDLGGAVDITIFPVVDFGPHLVLSGIAGDEDDDPFSWVEVGGHVTFSIGQ